LSALLRHREQQQQERIFAGSKWKESGFVFTTGIGTPVEPRNLERAHRQILSAAKLPYIRIHDLRHTTATLLLTQGVHPSRYGVTRTQSNHRHDEHVLARGSLASEGNSKSDGRGFASRKAGCYQAILKPHFSAVSY
jgi:integrase